MVEIGEGEEKLKEGAPRFSSPSPNLSMRLAPSPLHFKGFRVYRIPVADFPKIRKKDMRLEAEFPPYPAQAGMSTAFGIPSGRHSDPGCSRAFYSPYPQSNATRMIDILNLTFPELERFIVEDLGQPKFRAAQVWQWIWQKHATSFDAMTDVSKQLRAKLAEVAEIVLPEIVTVQTSSDGTEKLLLRLRDGALVETVILPSTGQDGSVRIAQCVSSQIGCAMGCTFCSTGTMGFIRNMTAGEILSQVLVARMRLGDNRIDHPIIRNLVFMGMGEPLLNLRETTRALEMLNHDKGMDFSPRRITVSTCGIKAGLRELGDSGLAFLAVSLHAPNQDLRAKIMPKAANWHLDDLMATLESYPLKTREHITFEYLLLGGVNDQPEHARELAKLVSRVKGKLNLIAYNPSETQLYKAPTEADILAFEKILWSKGVTAILRKSKGQDIKAACGQLKSDWEREKGDEE